MDVRNDQACGGALCGRLSNAFPSVKGCLGYQGSGHHVDQDPYDDCLPQMRFMNSKDVEQCCQGFTASALPFEGNLVQMPGSTAQF